MRSLILLLLFAGGCATISKSRIPATQAAVLSTQAQLRDILVQSSLPVMQQPEIGTYVYNDVWCSDPKKVEFARNHLAAPDSKSIKFSFLDENQVKIVHTTTLPYEPDCLWHMSGEYSVRNSQISYSSPLRVDSVEGSTCRKDITLEDRKMAAPPMIPIYDKKRDKYLMLLSISPLGGVNYCGTGNFGYQIYELLPMF